MKRLLQIALPFVILLGAALIVYVMILNKAEPEKRRVQAPSPQVTVRTLEPESFQIVLNSQGTVRARTESSLIPEVRGRVMRIAQNFQEGAFFEEGDVLLEIDDRDYVAELTVAEAAQAQADLNLAQEEARYDQAKRDWDRLNPGLQAAELALREPQIRQARAAAASAKARVDTARLNLERTKLKAPFAGRVLTKSVDVGQFVSIGAQVARLYAVDYAEVRLPLTAKQFSYLNLPAVYRGGDLAIERGPKVVLSSTVAGVTHSWEGQIVRSEGAVDTRTRQLFVVAQVENPYGKVQPERPPLKVGSFVEARINGMVLEDVFVVPRRLYRENSYVLIVDQEKYLTRRSIEVVWEDNENIVARGGLEAGELLCLTDVPYSLEGWPVAARFETNAPPSEMLAQADGPERRRPAGDAPARSYADSVMLSLGDKLPSELREKLTAAKDAGDRAVMGTLMRQIDEWAKANGHEMPPNPMSGGRPSS